MKYIIKESQYVNLLENLDKNKKFLTNHMGIDFTGKIKQITSAYKVPYNFYRNGGISLNHAMSYLNNFGPMYFFELGDYEYLYQDRGNKDWFIDEYGHRYIKDEFSERLGLDVLGLRFSDIVNMYFNEEEEDMITESKQNNVVEQVLKSEGITYKIYYKKRSYFRGDQLDSVDINFDSKEGFRSFPMYFKTRGTRIISGPLDWNDITKVVDAFNFIPKDIVNDYFTNKAKRFLEEYLPIEYPSNFKDFF
jgi:hypothetical protein